MRWTKEEKETFVTAIEKWGTALQWLMVWEETAELGVKVAQMLRGREVAPEDLAEEIADVLIMMGQAMHMIDPREVEIAYYAKLRRLQERLLK